MHYKNFMEQVVTEKLEELLKGRTDICSCDQCKVEMTTYALNHLPPKYVSSLKGEVFNKIDGMDAQQNADITKTLTAAIKVVSSNPRHRK